MLSSLHVTCMHPALVQEGVSCAALKCKPPPPPLCLRSHWLPSSVHVYCTALRQQPAPVHLLDVLHLSDIALMAIMLLQ